MSEVRRIGAALLCVAVVAVFAGCEWLLGLDTTPPTCRITSPTDSALVNGVVPLAATASDSIGVDRVEFYADGLLVSSDSFSPYAANWDVSGFTEGTWHSVSGIAYDLSGNKGYSDTVAVEIAALGPRSVYHGELDVQATGREVVSFEANLGDTLNGDVQIVAGGTLSTFLWLDKDNYQKYIANQSYTALFRQESFSQMSMRQAAATSGKFYLVFANAGSSEVKCWVRFVLE